MTECRRLQLARVALSALCPALCVANALHLDVALFLLIFIVGVSEGTLDSWFRLQLSL